MGTDPVDARLRELARLSAASLDSDEARLEMAARARAARRDAVVDMSEAAIDQRISELSSLSALCASLGRARTE